jgi:hypothetical protein
MVWYGMVCTIYNMSGRVVSHIQTRAEVESFYTRYNTDANAVKLIWPVKRLDENIRILQKCFTN